MRFLPALALILPASVASATATADKWPNVTYGESPSSQHVDSLFQRDAIAEAALPQKPAKGVKKMSDDEGEKFYFHYWQFDDELPVTEMANSTGPDDAHPLESDGGGIQNRTYLLRPAIALDERHAENRRAVTPRYIPSLFQRDFKCPTGTSACSAIGRPNRCCGAGDTCTLVQDTGAGDVGCCPQGQTCSNTIGSCPGGYSACSESLGGGCCIPGYECVQGGCAHITIVTVTVHSTVMVSTRTFTTPRETSSSSISSTSTNTVSTGDLTPPARPTGLSTVTTSESTETGGGASSCPTGFYACSAVYQGGCCRTGRDCDTTSCPVVSSTTMVSNGRTIVAPAPTMTGGGGRRCAQGWFSCADTVGGGCCPTGFACGSSCAATGGQATTLAKTPPESSVGSRISWEDMRMVVMSVVFWIAVMML